MLTSSRVKKFWIGTNPKKTNKQNLRDPDLNAIVYSLEFEKIVLVFFVSFFNLKWYFINILIVLKNRKVTAVSLFVI